MRIVALVAIMVLAAFPAFAQEGHLFGSSICRAKVACPESGNLPSSADLANIGNSCVAQGFGMSAPGGFFDDIMGLDLNNCLTLKSGAVASNNGRAMVPQCCLVPSPNGGCTFSCQIATH